MLLLTGATGSLGSALLRRLTAAGETVRCLVDDPRRLGEERVRVQIALGELTNPASFRNALRGVGTVIPLAAAARSDERASLEELNAVATFRLARAAERAGAERFLLLSALGASPGSGSRFLRARALAERAVEHSPLDTIVVASSIVFSPADEWLKRLERLSYLPAVPVPPSGRARFQPIWSEDAAACIVEALRPSADGGSEGSMRLELAGPEVLSWEGIVATALRSFGRRRRLVQVPRGLVKTALELNERLAGPAAFATWSEAELAGASMTTPRGTADAERLGVDPLPMRAVLGAR